MQTDISPPARHPLRWPPRMKGFALTVLRFMEAMELGGTLDRYAEIEALARRVSALEQTLRRDTDLR